MSERVVYEVNLTVDPDGEQAFAAWLRQHVAEMIALPGFCGARQYRVEDEASLVFCVHYELESRAALDHYFETWAEQMRGDGIARFGDQMTATRRILTT